MTATLLTCLVYLLLAGAAVALTTTTYTDCTACCARLTNTVCGTYAPWPDTVNVSLLTTDACIGSGSNVLLALPIATSAGVYYWQYIGPIAFGAGQINDATLITFSVNYPSPGSFCGACVILLIIDYECPIGTPQTVTLKDSRLIIPGFTDYSLPADWNECNPTAGGTRFTAYLSA